MALRIKYIKFILILSLIFCAAVAGYSAARPNQSSVEVSGKKINVELADTPEKKYTGLSGRDDLCPDCGMLFIFSPASRETFVMRDMKFSLDIIWISGGKIVKIDFGLAPEGATPKIYYQSPGPVDYVLEVNGGFSKTNNIKVNDQVKINL